MATNRPLIGLDMLYYAEVISDDDTGTNYDTPVRIYNAVSLSVNPNTTIATFFADDGPAEAYSQIGEVDVAIQIADLPPEDLAFLIGADYDIAVAGVLDYDTGANAPDVAIGFRAQKTNGEYRYIWLMKGRFGVPDMEHQTKEAGVNFQPQTINGKFLARTYDSMVFRRADEDDTNVAMTLPADWFAGGPNLGVAPAALTLTSVTPLNLAAAVAVGTTVEWEFSADVLSTDITSSNFSLYDVTNDVAVAGSLGVDPADDSIVVFTPSAALTAASLHVANVEAGVRSTAGGALANQIISTFTTA